jgi:hypothetical protein
VGAGGEKAGEVEPGDAGLVGEEAAAVVADDQVNLVAGVEEDLEGAEGVGGAGGAGDAEDDAARGDGSGWRHGGG